jgi:hypothetical protein
MRYGFYKNLFHKAGSCATELLPFGRAGMGRTEFGFSQALVLFVLHHNLVWTFWFSFLGFESRAVFQ